MMVPFHDIAAAAWLFVPAFAANMAPVLVQGHFDALAIPIDGHRQFRGRRILGDHKTWRGIIAGIVFGIVAYEIQRSLDARTTLHDLALFDYASHPIVPGLLLGLGTGVGDAVKSFFKRQIGIAPGGTWIPFDQLDFVVGAYVFVAPIVVAPLLPLLLTAPLILAGSVATSAIGYRLGLKEAWI